LALFLAFSDLLMNAKFASFRDLENGTYTPMRDFPLHLFPIRDFQETAMKNGCDSLSRVTQAGSYKRGNDSDRNEKKPGRGLVADVRPARASNS
jgi:hypothetical protein